MSAPDDVDVGTSHAPDGDHRVTLAVEHDYDGVESAAAVHLTTEQARRVASALGVAANAPCDDCGRGPADE